MSAWTVKFLEWETPLQGEYIEKELTLEDIKEIWDEGDLTYSLAVEIERLTIENAALKVELDSQEEYSICDCCYSLTTDPVDAGGHVQCQSCTKMANLEAENAALRDALTEIEGSHQLSDEPQAKGMAQIARKALSTVREP